MEVYSQSEKSVSIALQSKAARSNQDQKKNNKKMKLNSFSKEYHKKLRRDKLHFWMFIFLLIMSVIQLLWLFYLLNTQTFTMGFYVCVITTLANVCAFMLKSCIFDKGYNRKMRSIVIYWMCCIRISDPFD